jgi:hypothetical protein
LVGNTLGGRRATNLFKITNLFKKCNNKN